VGPNLATPRRYSEVTEMRLAILILVLSSPAICAQTTLPSAPHVYVQGVGEVEVEPDTLRISGSISVTALEAALGESEVQQRSAALLSLAREFDISADAIRASTVAVSPSFDYNGGQRRFTGYNVNRDFSIEMEIPDDYYSKVQRIVESGALDYVDVVFSYSDIDGAVRDAQLVAIDDARGRAESLAEQAGARLGSVYSISEFDLRQDEQYLLTPDRTFFESELNTSDTIVVTGSRVRGSSAVGGIQLFRADTVAAAAQVYVVYYLEPL
jgi:uncharacterized protein YggE